LIDYTTEPSSYEVPFYHQQAFADGQKMVREVKVRNVVDASKLDPNYKNTGLRMRIHWMSTKAN
jgi:hypothetical protein